LSPRGVSQGWRCTGLRTKCRLWARSSGIGVCRAEDVTVRSALP
jgi:hypothetical protein